MQNTGPERNMNTLYFFFGNTRKRRRVHLTQTLSRDGNKQKEEILRNFIRISSEDSFISPTTNREAIQRA